MKRSWPEAKKKRTKYPRAGKQGKGNVRNRCHRESRQHMYTKYSSTAPQSVHATPPKNCQLKVKRRRWQHDSQRRQRRVILAETEPSPTAHEKRRLCLSYAQFPRGQRIQSSIMHGGVWVECGSSTTQDMGWGARLCPIRANYAPDNKARHNGQFKYNARGQYLLSIAFLGVSVSTLSRIAKLRAEQWVKIARTALCKSVPRVDGAQGARQQE